MGFGFRVLGSSFVQREDQGVMFLALSFEFGEGEPGGAIHTVDGVHPGCNLEADRTFPE